MKKIGLIGEDPNDTRAVQNLLSQHFYDNVRFKPILRHIKGSHLSRTILKKAIETELEKHDCSLIIFIRDLDGGPTERAKMERIENWFQEVSKNAAPNSLLLVNIYELEALVLADIEIFNNEYKTNISNNRNVMYIPNPKELLKRKTNKSKKRYAEKDCPELFKKLRYDVVKENCKYFKDFTDNLTTILKK